MNILPISVVVLALTLITDASRADQKKPFPVNIQVHAEEPIGELKPLWRFFGADEPNYATRKNGEKLLAELGDLRPQDPLGAMAMSNCSCGTTLALTSEGMPLPHLWSVHQWANAEAKSRGIKIAVFLQDARRLTRQRVLGAGADGLPVSR